MNLSLSRYSSGLQLAAAVRLSGVFELLRRLVASHEELVDVSAAPRDILALKPFGNRQLPTTPVAPANLRGNENYQVACLWPCFAPGCAAVVAASIHTEWRCDPHVPRRYT